MKYDYSNVFNPPCLILEIGISPLENENWIKLKAILDTGADISVFPQILKEEFDLSVISHKFIQGATDRDEDVIVKPSYFL